ncbi:carboxymuconolactone decarboxylase family protein [Catellatospora tritici]|uniref:carboxymuconolactone decarboxylase family protein n=1 Tax=Catellatospora tritici TaxID=2851566 RepID=UPI001C2D8154|nr:alkylhydroperoxidase AhpD family core domain-containing protein [Catellatospora tritici]MBV1852283.1 alkylhydroperoxidase AhpD family core domain-containing protein [Catellatospora tritici]
MRLPSLSRSWRFSDRVKLKLIRIASGRPPADILKILHYRREFFGEPFTEWVHQVLRGPSEWSIGERELMASFVSHLNQCRFCEGSHAAIVEVTLGPELTEAVLADWRTAPLRPGLRAAFALLEVLTLKPGEVGPELIEAAYQAGVTERGVRDVIHICGIFCTINRVADAVDFAVPDDKGLKGDAYQLLKRGYAIK